MAAKRAFTVFIGGDTLLAVSQIITPHFIAVIRTEIQRFLAVVTV
jgi:hypothetical protein